MSLRDRIAAKLAKWTAILKDMADAAALDAESKTAEAKRLADLCPACGKPKKHGPPETLCWCE